MEEIFDSSFKKITSESDKKIFDNFKKNIMNTFYDELEDGVLDANELKQVITDVINIFC